MAIKTQMMSETDKNIRVSWAINNAVQIVSSMNISKKIIDYRPHIKIFTEWFIEYFDEAHELLEKKLLDTLEAPDNLPVHIKKAETKYQKLVESKGLDGGSMKGEVYSPPTGRP